MGPQGRLRHAEAVATTRLSLVGRTEVEAAYRDLLARRTRMQRGRLGLTQQQVAMRTAGLGRHFVGAVERGAATLDRRRLSLLAEALGTTASWLLEPRDGDMRLPER